jgi:hypothetical protein
MTSTTSLGAPAAISRIAARLAMAAIVVPLGPDAYGPGVNTGWPPRFAFLTYMVWVCTRLSAAVKIRMNFRGEHDSSWPKSILRTWTNTSPSNLRPHKPHYGAEGNPQGPAA